jgi:putative oxidoreductase
MFPPCSTFYRPWPFFGAGAAKLSEVPEVIKPFAILALPPAFGLFIGICEIAGSIGWLIARTRIPAAIRLSLIMLGAVYYHLVYQIPSVVPAMILLIFLAGNIWRARKSAAAPT